MYGDGQSLLRRFVSDARGATAVVFGLSALVLVGAAGASIDYAVLLNQRAKLQSAADAAALAAASEGPVHAWDSGKLTEIASSFAKANLGAQDDSTSAAQASVSVNRKLKSVTVGLREDGESYFLRNFFDADIEVAVSARATLHGEASICVLALDEHAGKALSLAGASSMFGNGCAVISNSESRSAISAELASRLTSRLTCTAGGYSGLALSFKPAPVTDCPRTRDPLTFRALQNTGSCTATDLHIDGDFRQLSPGTYCGETRLSNNAEVELRPGTYTFEGGLLIAQSGSSLAGENVTLQFRGADTGFSFANDTTVSLTAPVTGPGAGILVHADTIAGDDRPFHIMSADAERMIGAIYLPSGEIVVGGDINLDGVCDLLNGIVPSSCQANLGQRSHWTAIVARRVTTTLGANIVLNTDFAATDIPAPEGIGGIPHLER